LALKVSETAASPTGFWPSRPTKPSEQNHKSSDDYIVVGSGAAGSVVARRRAENPKSQVLLVVGDEDLKPNVQKAENWYFNQRGVMDWSFAAEPAAAVNNRSIHQARGKVSSGGTSINRMVWARGH
jgi:choline dehydrogenase-like flavoprotein